MLWHSSLGIRKGGQPVKSKGNTPRKSWEGPILLVSVFSDLMALHKIFIAAHCETHNTIIEKHLWLWHPVQVLRL